MTIRGWRGRPATRRWISVAIAAVALAPAQVGAGEGFKRFSSMLKGESSASEPAEEPSGPIETQMKWWSIPRTARVAAKKLAADQDASITRCVAIEEGDKVTYEIHASHRLGLFRRDDFVLTGVTEPKVAAEKREEERGLKKWWERRHAEPSLLAQQEQRSLNSGQTTPASRRRFFGLFDRSR